MKTIIEERETQVNEQAISRNQGGQPAKAVRIQDKAEAIVTQAKVDTYESCLDLAALFLGRG